MTVDRDLPKCEFCRGLGVICAENERHDLYHHKNGDTILWLVCRMCHGRGYLPHECQWNIPWWDRWHGAKSWLELLHFAAMVRCRAPAHPHDKGVYSEEDQIAFIAERTRKLRKEIDRILLIRLREMWSTNSR